MVERMELLPVVRPDRSINVFPITFINPILLGVPLSYISFLVTRGLVRVVARSKKLALSLLAWSVDILSLVPFAIAVHKIMNWVAILYWSHPGVCVDLPWPGRLSLFEIPALVAVLLPTFCHTLFVIFVVIMITSEGFRCAVVYVLERIDEDDRAPLTVITSICSAFAGLVFAVRAMFK